jgi:hypothetical protein
MATPNQLKTCDHTIHANEQEIKIWFSDSSKESQRIQLIGSPTDITLDHGWRVLFDRITTKESLIARGAISADKDLCVFCNVAAKRCNHLLMSCSFAHNIWMSIYRWMSYEGVFAENVHDHFMQYGR